jgi:prophage regulatory protein
MSTDTPVTAARSSNSRSSLHILRLPRVCEITGLGRSMIYQLETDGLFPQRVKLTTRTVGWLEGEVHDWIAQRIAHSRRPASAHSAAPPMRARVEG